MTCPVPLWRRLPRDGRPGALWGVCGLPVRPGGLRCVFHAHTESQRLRVAA